MSLPSLKQFILRSIDRPQAPRLRFSQAGSDCSRRTYYEAVGQRRDDARDEADAARGAVKMAIGTAFDAYALADAAPELLAEYEMVPQQAVTLTLGGVTIRGSSDAVFASRDGSVVWDLKTVGMGRIVDGEWKAGTWEKVQREPKQEHSAQVNLYAYALGAAAWGVCYVNANTGEIRELGPFQTDAFKARKDFGLFEEVAFFIAKGWPPPKPYDDIEDDDGNVRVAKDSFPCGYCAFNASCWSREGVLDAELPAHAAR